MCVFTCSRPPHCRRRTNKAVLFPRAADWPTLSSPLPPLSPCACLCLEESTTPRHCVPQAKIEGFLRRLYDHSDKYMRAMNQASTP